MPENLAYKAYQLVWKGIDYLYPPNCGGCGTPGVRWCEDCARKTKEISAPICPVCGNQNFSDQPCQRCLDSPPFYTAHRSTTIYHGPIRTGIIRLKYQHDIGLGEVFARMMITQLQKVNWTLNLITAVPLGLVRLKERGYNQATLLARPISFALRVPFSPNALTRIRETRSQVGLTIGERHDNMAGAFQAKEELVEGKTILLIDDVATSGATVNACSKALLDAGATIVYGFSLARAQLLSDGDMDIADTQ
jgi:ComF family protein